MLLGFPLFLLYISSEAFQLFDDDHGFLDSSRLSQRKNLINDVGLPPRQQGKPDPKTVAQMQDRFGEDMKGILDGRSRAHFDDLSYYFQPNIVLRTCFSRTMELTVRELQHVLFYLSAYYQTFIDWEMDILTQDEYFVDGILFYNAIGADGKKIHGKWKYEAFMDWNKRFFVIDLIQFMWNCTAIPRSVPQDPVEEVANFIERIRVKLMSGLFLPDGVYRYLVDFEEFGDNISEDAHIVVCDEPLMRTQEFIKYMSDRYYQIHKYADNEFSYNISGTNFEITFSTTWTDSTIAEHRHRDTYVFRVRKEKDYYPEFNNSFFLWKFYWVTKKCTVDATEYSSILVSGSVQLAEVNKRFCSMIVGDNWDVYQAFLDLYDPKEMKWGTCSGPNDQTYGKLREYMENMSSQYSKCEVSAVHTGNLKAVEFSTTFLLTRARESQEREEHVVLFAGYQDKKGLWRMNGLHFDCQHTKKRKFIDF